jgi:hypothetical protein
MASLRSRIHPPALTVESDRPLIGLVSVEDGQDVARYYADEADIPTDKLDTVAKARALAGAWSDLDWQQMVDELDRIRRESVVTPPIDDL